MRKYVVMCAMAAMTLIGSGQAWAQEAGQVGVSTAYPSSVGLTIHLTDKIAIRPEGSFGRSSSSYAESLTLADRNTRSFGAGIGVLFYVAHWDNTQVYVTPKWNYVRTTAEDDNGGNETRNTGHTVTGSFGVQQRLGNRFAVFGEAGLAWNRSENSGLTGVTSGKVTSWSTRSAVGAIFYF